MTRRNLALLLAIISFICLGFIAQANFFITKINVIERENSNLSVKSSESKNLRNAIAPQKKSLKLKQFILRKKKFQQNFYGVKQEISLGKGRYILVLLF